MKDVLLDSLYDSLKVLLFVFIIYVILSFFEDKLSHSKVFSKNNKFSPLIGSLFGLVPQCGMSVLASDMYIKRHITVGTLLAVFISCSDEALPIMLAHSGGAKWAGLVILVKFILGFIVGFLVDMVYKPKDEIEEGVDNEIHTGCCHHHIDDEEENRWHKHLVHPLIHSVKLFIYVFVVNIIFGMIVYFVGENSISNFLSTNKYITPLLSSIVGMIPNCASSVIITELYLSSGLSFGALISGLIMNAGLGMVVLLKNKSMIKKTLFIWLILFLTSLICGYTICFIFGF